VKVRSKEPYWLLRNGIIHAYPSLKENISCDILVVGGGVTGALVAHQFSSAGHKTIVIDKRDIGFGSTSATTAMIQYEIDKPLYKLAEVVGREAAVDSYLEGISAIGKLKALIESLSLDCGFKTQQSLQIARYQKDVPELRKEFEYRNEIGIDVEWLSKEKVMRRFDLVSEGAILSEAAASMDAYRFAHLLLAHDLKHHDLKVFDHTALEKVVYGKSNNKVIVSNGASITCNYIIYATGYESHELIKSNIGRLLSTYACISEPIEKFPHTLHQTILWNTQDPYFYCRTTDDNRILIGGEDEDFKDPEKRDALIDKKETDLIKNFRHLRPDVKFIPDFTWAGTFSSTKDSLPYIGSHPKFRRSFFLLGFGGNGITFSVMGMEILSDAVAGRPNKFLEYFKFDR
jgi:glycine/D-amino acid oxidase-like deaminating enzyme